MAGGFTAEDGAGECFVNVSRFCYIRQERSACTHVHVHVLITDEKKERKKQGQTNKQGKATQHTQGSTFPKKNELHMYMYNVHVYVYMYVYVHVSIDTIVSMM